MSTSVVTEQEIFNTVAIHLITQGRRASADGVSCKYRTAHTPPLKCAVGVLIPDTMYRGDMENTTVSRLIPGEKTFGYTLPAYFRAHVELLSELQRVHDYAFNWEDNNLLIALAELAGQRKLNTTVLLGAKLGKRPPYANNVSVVEVD